MKSRLFLTILVVAMLFPVNFVNANTETYDIHVEINQDTTQHLIMGVLPEETHITGEVHSEDNLTGIRAGYTMYILDETLWQLVLEERTEELDTTSAYRVVFGRFDGMDNTWVPFEYTVPENNGTYFYFMQTIGAILDQPATAEGYVNVTRPTVTTTTTTTTTTTSTPTERPTTYEEIWVIGTLIVGAILSIIIIATKDKR